jgi:rhamnogalacturonyl hydrolase YesR
MNYKKIIIYCCLVVCWMGANQNLYAQESGKVSTRQLVTSVFEMGKEHCDLGFYAGTLMLHGMSEFALLEGKEEVLNEVISIYEKFGNGEIEPKGNFISYEAGGSGAAYLSWKGATDKLDPQVAAAAEKMMKNQMRSPENVMTSKDAKYDLGQVFIDVAFAVTPYLLYTGLKFEKPEYVDYAVFETLELFRILRDEKTGLVHQARGYQGLGKVTEDCWSRGNGWGAFALAILVRDLPVSHPRYEEVAALAKEFFTAVLKFQNDQGLWHQEMTEPSSYVETSGSGLLLYGLGLVLENGLIDRKYVKNFETGIENLTSYIGSDWSVSHTAFSCRAIKDGTKDDYINHPWVYNDHHAFGPVILAFVQAARMGMYEVLPAQKLGQFSIKDSPKVPRTYVKYARGNEMAWENDRIAFRAFGPSVRGKVANGIDVWAKSVDYPILDKWYKLNAEGKDYHKDRGEGADFYNMGKRIGCGGLALWIDGKPYAPDTFDGHRIIQNQDNGIEFDLNYNTWKVPGMKLREQKKIQMEEGSNLFKVTSTITSDENNEIMVAIGLTTFGKAQKYQNKEKGILSCWEDMGSGHGNLGTAILVDPDSFAGLASYEGDEFILIKTMTNQPFSYYAGAGWDRNNYFKKQKDWRDYLLGFRSSNQ